MLTPLTVKALQVQVLTFYIGNQQARKPHENLFCFAIQSPSLLEGLVRVLDSMCCSRLHAKISVVNLRLVFETLQTKFEITSGGCLLFEISD